MMNKLIGSLLLAGLALAACKVGGAKVGKKGQGGANVSNFAGKGSLCGTYVSYRGLASDGKENAGKPANIMVSIGVCGDQNGGKWKALALTQVTDTVSVKVGEKDGKSGVFVDDTAIMIRRPDGKAVKMGSMAKAENGASVKLDDGVDLQVMVDGEPFSLESKSSAEKIVLVTLP